MRDTWAERHSPRAYSAVLRRARRTARAGVALPWAITLDRVLVGQLTVQNVVRGALQGASAGYWVDRDVAGRGVMPTALALAVDHCFGPVGLHRLEVAIRPENAASRRVVEKLGLREVGLAPRLLMIDGAWRDHLRYAVTVEEVGPGGLLARWRATRGG